jgi:hypothetical protein
MGQQHLERNKEPMITSQQLIDRLQAIQTKLGRAVYVAVSVGDDLPDIKDITTATDTGQTEQTIVVLHLDT